MRGVLKLNLNSEYINDANLANRMLETVRWRVTLIWCCAIGVAAGLDLNFYYSDNGGYTNSCPSEKCLPCGKGQYRSGCGNTGAGTSDLQKASPGSCEACTARANSVWDDYPASGTFNADSCPFSCITGFSKSGSACVPNACSPLNDNTKEYITSENDSPACRFVCKAGYRGDTAFNPSTCTVCGPGTFSLQGSDSCSQCEKGYFNDLSAQNACSVCLRGTYSASTGSTQCEPCEKGKFGASTGLSECAWCDPVDDVPQYANTTGRSACTPCERCTERGKYKLGCGRASAGSCAQCTA